MTHDHLRLDLTNRLDADGNRDQHAARSERSADVEDAGQHGRDGRQNCEEQFYLDFPPAFILFMPSSVLFGPPTTCIFLPFFFWLSGIPSFYTLRKENAGSPTVDI